MNPAAKLLERLEGVRERGAGKWSARCPAHADRSPSLSIEETGDRVLIHCFAGCGAAEVMAAAGLSLSDLFETPPEPYRHERPPPGDGRQALRRSTLRLALFQAERDALRAAVAAENVARGIELTGEDIAIVADAARRLNRLAGQFRAWEF